ncbi:MAG: CgeB family protein [Vicinamibacterales bacterium]
MKLVVFGLTISSAWGNGHATLWRALCRALHARGHEVVFFERDMPYYANHRDWWGTEWCRLVLYDDWSEVAPAGRRELAGADVGMVTSYCPDGPAASSLVCDANVARKVFYDLDAPVTLERLDRGESVPYLPDEGLGEFDLVLSYAGGSALHGLRTRLGARAVAPLYGSVDPALHYPVTPSADRRNDLSYLGTYADDRQAALERLFLVPARLRPWQRFAIAGAQYPADFPWLPNILYFRHMPPPEHPALFCSSRFTLNITRAAMAAVGYCPSGRLFEAAACGVPMISDWWDGLDEFFEPSREVLIARDTDDVMRALDLSDEEKARIGRAGRERTLACHTADTRANELEHLLEPRWCGQAGAA